MKGKRYLIFVIVFSLCFISSQQVFANNYAGSEICKQCHQDIFDKYSKTGHPYKLQKVNGGPPVYPEGTSPGVPNPPADKTWDDISYVIGGFGWKARFMDSEGYILTGDADRQYNLANAVLGTEAGWTGYDAAKAPRKPYTCGSCHTTGWVSTGEAGPHQDDLPGIQGTWAEPGVRCEACHGPASDHVNDPSNVKPSKEENCGSCHSRGDVDQIDAKGGLIKHHEQYEDLLASPHKIFKCGTCHEPHQSTKYKMGGFKGEDATCKTCHANVEIKIAAKADFKCTTCHMPYAAKSAVSITIETAEGPVPKGDIRSHIFRIKDDPNWNMFTDDGHFVRVDEDHKAYLTVEYTCLTCHTTKDKAWAAANARAVHGTKPMAAYVGSNTCKGCHPTIYDDYMKTGHPYKIQKVEGGPPSYPEGTSPGVPNPPADKTWNDITYVIGGFGWKARFMDSEGYILTGDANRQYNLRNAKLGTDAGWVGYDAAKGPRKPYTCGSCHTTGWVSTGEAGPHQDDLPGIHGTWAEPGVRCEACHGPGGEHVTNPTQIHPTKAENCGDCHSRGDVNKIDAKDGLIKHHEQYEDLLASPHVQLNCKTCHKPHLSTKYEMGGFIGEEETCKTCHADIQIKVAAKENFKCTTCHMPYAAKSAVAITIETGSGPVPKGDIRSHIFRIKDDADWNMFTDDGKYVRLDEGKAYLSVAYTCLTCHTSKDVAWAAEKAETIHEGGTFVASDDSPGDIPVAYSLYQNYPNPFNPTTTISFDLKETSVVEITLYNATGQEITTLMNERLPAGHHSLSFSAQDLPSGMYLYRLKANDFVETKKMVLMK